MRYAMPRAVFQPIPISHVRVESPGSVENEIISPNVGITSLVDHVIVIVIVHLRCLGTGLARDKAGNNGNAGTACG